MYYQTDRNRRRSLYFTNLCVSERHVHAIVFGALSESTKVLVLNDRVFNNISDRSNCANRFHRVHFMSKTFSRIVSNVSFFFFFETYK